MPAHEDRPRRTPAFLWVAALLLATGAAVWAVAGQDAGDDDLAARQEHVAAVGAQVMPFDLDATRHRFEPTADGGLQTVVALDPDDAGEVAAIREHLRAEARAFAAGDFSDPATIHGDDMPGLPALTAGADRIAVTYEELPDGAAVRYATDDAELVTALHSWFDAQVLDHGEHAEHADTDE